MLTDGELTVTTIFDKPDTPEGPTFEETLLVTPSRLAQPILSEALRAAERAAGALGLRYGPIHAELRLDARNHRRQPTMLELAARSIGGLCSRALRFLDGVSLEQLVLANALGRQVTPHRLARRRRAHAAGGTRRRAPGCARHGPSRGRRGHHRRRSPPRWARPSTRCRR